MSSWTLTVGPVCTSGLAAALDEALLLLGGHEREQADVAAKAVLAVVGSGTVGPSGVRVQLAGMASVGHVGLADGAPSDPYVQFSIAHVPVAEPEPVVEAPAEADPKFEGALLGVPTGTDVPVEPVDEPTEVPEQAVGTDVPAQPVIGQGA